MSPFAAQWSLDPTLDFLNHGAFGACPRPVLATQDEWRARLERQPVHFMMNELEPALDAARNAIAAFVGAEPTNLVFVTNTTVGVNTILASLPLRPGDELVVTDHGYGACTNAARYWAGRAGATVTTARVTLPVREPGDVVRQVLSATSERTRLVLVDHVTSPTGIVFPVAELVQALRARGILSLVHGAHAPGMLPLDLRALGADYYVGNLHKWCCTPKGSAILVVRPEHQPTLRPLVISHGATATRRDRPKLWLEFDWTGTIDPTGILASPRAIEWLAALLPGGFPALMAANRALAIRARGVLLDAVGGVPLCPESMLGSLVSVTLPDTPEPDAFPNAIFSEPLYGELLTRRFQTLAIPWPTRPHRLLRVTAQIYNELSQYERLAATLQELLP